MDIKKIAQIEIAVLLEAVNRLEKLKDEYNKETAYGIVLAILEIKEMIEETEV